MKLGFIGIGVMGKAMAGHLLDAGYEVHVFNRTKAKADTLLERGAIWQDSPAEVTKQVDLVLSIVGYPEDVREIYFGEEGILPAVRPGQILIDMTTSTPALAKEIAAAAEAKEALAFDAPVSGGDLGARNGTLTVMVGGEETAFESVKPILSSFAKEVRYFGPAGSGQHTKVANQIMVAGTMTGLTEMLAYAKAADLTLEDVLQTVGGGAAANWSLTNYGPRILQADYSPGFFVKHFVKDLKIALDEAEAMGLSLPATTLAYDLYEQLAQDHADEGTQALIKLWWPDGE